MTRKRTHLFLFIGYTLCLSTALINQVLADRNRTKGTPRFNKVMTVIFENTNYSDALKQPYFSDFAKRGALMTSFYAEAHPSQPNYIALTAGSTHGVKSDRTVDLDVKNIADLLEENGKSWKVYAEGFPGDCFLGSQKGKYVRRHVPFLNYVNIQKNPSRCQNIVNAIELQKDIQNGTLPDYSFYVPDLDNDGHDTGPAFASNWFQKTFDPLLQNPTFMDGMLLIATFDEASYFLSSDKDEDRSIFSNQIYTVLYGNSVQPGSRNNQKLNHYSLLQLIEEEFSLNSFGLEDDKAPLISGIWN